MGGVMCYLAAEEVCRVGGWVGSCGTWRYVGVGGWEGGGDNVGFGC